MMRGLVMCARWLTQAHANQRTSQQYSSNYNPEVETEKPIKRKRKENNLDWKVIIDIDIIAHRQNGVVRKFAHAHIAMLASSYSDDVIAFEVKKQKNPCQISRISFSEIPQDLAEKLFLISFPCFQFFRKICKTKKHKHAKNENLPWQPLLFSILKGSSSQTVPVLSISENLTEGNWTKLKSKPNRGKKRRCLSSFNLRLEVLISEVTVEQQILALVCYVSVALFRKIAKRTRILTFDWGNWRALGDLA